MTLVGYELALEQGRVADYIVRHGAETMTFVHVRSCVYPVHKCDKLIEVQ